MFKSKKYIKKIEKNIGNIWVKKGKKYGKKCFGL